MSDNREFIAEFLVESSENLDQLDKDLLALEADPTDPQRLASVFRTVHTIKGNSGFFGFSKLGALAHSGEHLLGKLRDRKLRLDDRVAGTLYSMVDAVRTILQSIETAGNEGDHDYRELSRTLAAVAEQPQAAAVIADQPAASAAAATTEAEAAVQPAPVEPQPAAEPPAPVEPQPSAVPAISSAP
jgi:two-component system chemotaxis sensor kinase CheA